MVSCGKRSSSMRLVTGAHGFLDFGEDEDVGHGKFRKRRAGIARAAEPGNGFGYDGGKAVARMVGLR